MQDHRLTCNLKRKTFPNQSTLVILKTDTPKNSLLTHALRSSPFDDEKADQFIPLRYIKLSDIILLPFTIQSGNSCNIMV